MKDYWALIILLVLAVGVFFVGKYNGKRLTTS